MRIETRGLGRTTMRRMRMRGLGRTKRKRRAQAAMMMGGMRAPEASRKRTLGQEACRRRGRP
jgi:hypothetical protein